MTTYNTGNPIGSKDPRDLYVNAENLDEAVNTRQAESWDDRFGVARKTWWGMEQDFQQFLINSGYENIGDYAAGLEITARNQIFWRDGELYRAGASLALPYTTTGDWGDEEGLFVAVGDQSLRQELASSAGASLVGIENSTVEKAITYYTPEMAGCPEQKVKSSFVSAVANTVTLESGDSFSQEDVGKKIQIFAAGRTTSNGNFSHASEITSVESPSVLRIRTPVSNNVSGSPSNIGIDCRNELIAMDTYIRENNIRKVIARGTYFICGDEGDMELGHQITLTADNTEYDFSGSLIYGMINGTRSTLPVTYPPEPIVDTVIHGHNIICLGDSLDATLGNTNWNGCALAGIRSKLTNFTVTAHGGTRGVSAQTSFATAPIIDCEISNFELNFTGVSDTNDGVDVSANYDRAVKNLRIHNGVVRGAKRGVNSTQGTPETYSEDISMKDITVYDASGIGLRAARAENLLLDNINLVNCASTYLIIDCSGRAVNCDGLSSGTGGYGWSFSDTRTPPREDVDFSIIGGKVESSGMFVGGIRFASHGIKAIGVSVTNAENGMYGEGYRGLSRGCFIKNVNSGVRPTGGAGLEVVDLINLSDTLPPEISEYSRISSFAFVVFNGTGANGAPQQILSSHNIESVIRVSAGEYVVNFKVPPKKLYSISGSGRLFAGNITSVAPATTPSAGGLSVTIRCVSGSSAFESDYISATFT